MTLDAKRTAAYEVQVIGGVLLSNEAIDKALWLRPEDFYSPAHRRIWTAMLAAKEGTKPITLELETGDEWDHRILLDSTDTALPANLEYYAREVLRCAKNRRCHEALQRAAQDMKDGKESPEVAQDLAFLLQERPVGRKVTADEVAIRSFEAIERYQSGEAEAYLRTGFADLDKYAPARDELVVIAARPSVGKTALAVAISDNMATRGEAVLFESIEMSNEALYTRRLAMRSRLQMRTLRTKGALSADAWKIITANAQHQKTHPIHPGNSVVLPEILAEIREAKAQRNIAACFVDYLQLIVSPRGENRNHEIGEITKALARLCKELGITIFLLSQLTRGVEKRDDRRPVLSDLRDSGNIEQDADVVWFLHRPDFAKPKMTVLIAKARNDEAAVDVVLNFDAHTGRFSDAERRYEDDSLRRCGSD